MRAWAFYLALGACGCGGSAQPDSAIPEQSARSVLFPARLGWLSSEGPSGTLPSAVALGGKASGRVLLYLEFVRPQEPRKLLRADLLLETSGAPSAGIDVELSRSEPARGALSSWSEQPVSLYPRKSVRLAAGEGPTRLDVTELLRASSKPEEPLRMLLRAEPGEGAPVWVATGAASGAAPRLDTYWE